MKKRWIALALVSLGLTAVLAGCGSSSSSGKEKPFVYMTTGYGVDMGDAGLNPHKNYSGWSAVRYGVGETLFKFSDSMEPEPWLAESYQFLDPNTVEITLRSGIAFSNGNPVDGEAVKACLEHLIAVHDRAPRDMHIDSIEAEGNTVKIHTSEPCPALIHYLCDPYGAIIDMTSATGVPKSDAANARRRARFTNTGYQNVTLDDWVIRAKDLYKAFPLKTGETLPALNHLSLAVRRGELTAVIGPDGAGKTTLMRLIAGLMVPTSGSLSVLGLDSVKDAQEIQSRISYMPQKFGLYEDLTIQENLDLYADLHGIPQDTRKGRFAKLLDMTGLAPFTGRLAGKLSGGMKQKLGLACTLVRSPDLLILDEPTVGVDPLSRDELWIIIKQMVREENLSVIVCTAYMNEAAMCDHVYVLNLGQMLFEGTPQELSQVAAGKCFEVDPPEEFRVTKNTSSCFSGSHFTPSRTVAGFKKSSATSSWSRV